MEVEQKAFYEAMKQNILLSEQLRKSIRILWVQMIAVTLIGILVVVLLLVVLAL